MRMTPLDIKNQKFHPGFRGYRQEEVDEFLEKLIEDYVGLFDENRDFQDDLNKLNAQLSEYHSLKEAVERSVTLAQKTADETIRQAQNEARLILEDARVKAEKMLADAAARKEILDQETREAERRKSQFIMEFRLLLETHSRLLEGNGNGVKRMIEAG